jgi:hypothetical protein
MKKILLTATILASFASVSFANEPVKTAPAKAPVAATSKAPVAAPMVVGKAAESKGVVVLTKDQLAAIDAKCKKEHANVMSPEFKACVTLETKNASMPKTEVEGEGETVAPTEAPMEAPATKETK